MPKISALPAGTAPTGSELIPAVQSGVTVYLTAAQIANAARTTRTVTAAGSVTVLTTDQEILIAKTVADTTTINLPASATFAGDELFIKDLNGVCNTFNFTVTPFAGENIDGLSTYPMDINYAHIFMGKKTNGWFIKGTL